MDMGMIGLGRMGAAMARRLCNGGHRIVGFDGDPAARTRAEAPEKSTKAAKAATKGSLPIEVASSPADLVSRLFPPRVIWLMVPAGEIVDGIIAELRPLLARSDIIVDGGNSHYRDTQRRAATLIESGIDYIDCGTSGGVWGASEGYCLMVGGPKTAVEHLKPLFESLAPGPELGWARVGPSGAGHYVKMIHNGIEYGLMQAYAEGFALLRHKEEFALDPRQIAEVWRHGSVVRSWLLDLCANALTENPNLTGVAPYVADSGEGRWAVAEAVELDVPAPVMTLSLLTRLRSREPTHFAEKLLAALRNQFGGHPVRKDE